MTINGQPRFLAPRHPIQVVARATGLSPDVLRAWERRYQAVTPGRTPGAHRLYSDADIARLVLIRKALASGRRIGFVAQLPLEDLQALAVEDEAMPVRDFLPGERTASRGGGAARLESALDSVGEMNGARLERILDEAAMTLTTREVLENLVVPLLQEIGQRWRDGSLGIRHEHLATAAIRSWLIAARQSQTAPGGAPALVVATPAGQLHELGALIAALVAETAGWSVTYVGVDLPAEEIAATARQKRAHAVVLSLVYPPDDPRIPHELRRLKRQLPAGVALLAGGDAARRYARALSEVGARLVGSIADLMEALDGLRGQAT